ncbi:hypothetical protein GWI33_003782 [Rhynchophorus ferrugineus]|uniref:Uncharacterized protein n=1 Tax=Rhynchophorus ferrugineus TaxID=354439 RepID=A0A834HN57_RHYFE|nr:hypothetical protein GWI33_003782 [Rhynchophorus ferrugineus]
MVFPSNGAKAAERQMRPTTETEKKKKKKKKQREKNQRGWGSEREAGGPRGTHRSRSIKNEGSRPGPETRRRPKKQWSIGARLRQVAARAATGPAGRG